MRNRLVQIFKTNPLPMITSVAYSIYDLAKSGYLNPYNQNQFTKNKPANETNTQAEVKTDRVAKIEFEVESQAESQAEKTIKDTFTELGINQKVIVQFHKNNIFFFNNTNIGVDHIYSSPSNQDTRGVSTSLVTVAYTGVDELNDQETIRAIAGHEAIHVKHHHQQISAALLGLSLGYVLCSPSLSSFIIKRVPAIYFSNLILDKLCEVDADMTSAHRLGTHQALINFLEREKNMFNDFPLPLRIASRLMDSHPTHQLRINYLQLLKQNSTLFSFKPNEELNKEELNKKELNKEDKKISAYANLYSAGPVIFGSNPAVYAIETSEIAGEAIGKKITDKPIQTTNVANVANVAKLGLFHLKEKLPANDTTNLYTGGITRTKLV